VKENSPARGLGGGREVNLDEVGRKKGRKHETFLFPKRKNQKKKNAEVQEKGGRRGEKTPNYIIRKEGKGNCPHHRKKKKRSGIFYCRSKKGKALLSLNRREEGPAPKSLKKRGEVFYPTGEEECTNSAPFWEKEKRTDGLRRRGRKRGDAL